MNALKTLAAAGLIASSLAVAPAGAQAQTAPAAPAAQASGFDGYRVLAVTAGVMAGAAIATVVTDGLIVPVFAYAAGTGGAGGAGAGMGMAGIGNGIAHAGYGWFRGGMRLLGAIGGGFYADSWYAGR